MLTIKTYRHPLTESNSYILFCGSEAVIIDPNDADGLNRMLNKKTLKMILLTHEHCDHIAGLSALREKRPGVLVIASEACSDALGNAGLNMSRMMSVYLAFQGKGEIEYPSFVCEPADITFKEHYQLKWAGHHLRFFRMPGHTHGSTIIHLDEGKLFSGDYLIPSTDVVTRLPGGNSDDYNLQTLPYLKKLEAGLMIYPGHGEVYTLKEEILSEL